jgi:hypothetical protein
MAMIPTRHEITGHECDFPEDTIRAWRARGWIPLSELEETAATIAAEPVVETTPTPTRAGRVQPATPKEPTP